MAAREKTKEQLERELEKTHRRISEMEALQKECEEMREALRENEAKCRALTETMPYGLQENDTSGVITFSNPAHSRMHGYEEGELVGKAIWDLVESEEEREGLRRYLKKLIKEEPPPTPYLTVDVRKDGRLIDVQVDWNYKRDDEGRVVGFISVITDITERKRSEEQLRKLHGAVEQSQSIIVITDSKGDIEYVNPRFTELTGYTHDEAVGRNPRILKSGEHTPEFYEQLWDTITSGKEWRGEFHNRKRDGGLYWESASISPITNEDGEVTHFIAVKEDITDRRKAKEALLKSEASLAEAQRIARMGNWDWDIVENELHWSDEIYRIFGLTPREFGATFEAFMDSVHPDDRKFVKESVDNALYDGAPYDIDHRVVLPDGTERIVHEKAEVTFGKESRPVRMVGTVHDITERKRMEEELTRLAITDKLTQAYNRTKFDEIITEEIERARRFDRPLSVLMFDLDNFKVINDTFGHSFGDNVLKTMADIVRTHMRKINYFIRWGGEEFLIIAVETNLKGARVLAERLRKAIESHGFDKVGRVTISFGATEFRKDDTEDSLLKRADEALYKAKENGRNRVETVP